jgi:hypothetical protein
LLSRRYRIGDLTLLTSKLAFERGGAEFPLPEIPYKILLFIVLENLSPERRKVTVEAIASHIWPNEPQTDPEELKRRIHAHVRTLRRSGVTCLSHRTHGGYLLQGDLAVEEEAPAAIWLTSKSLVFATSLTSGVTLVVTAFVRGLVTSFNASLTQAPQFGFVSGAFQSVFGALAWTIPLSVALLYGWTRRVTYENWHAKLSLPSLLGAGALAGALGGFCVDIALLFAQQRETLYEARWIESISSSPWSAFTATKIGYVEPAMGIAVCLGCAAFMWFSLRSHEWEQRLKTSLSLGSLTDIFRLLRQIFERAILWALLLIDAPVMTVGAIFHFTTHSNISLARFLGEGLIIGTAGVAFTIGHLTSIYALAKGFKFTPD